MIKKLTKKQAFDHLKSKNITIAPGAVYNIFACGHVIKNTNDTHNMAYYPHIQRRNRTCPLCLPTPTKLITKVKICKCGEKQEGIRIQDSNQCRLCTYNKNTYVKKTPEQWAEIRKYRNKKQADISRSDCYHRLSGKNCLMKYINYDVVPCKNCKNYFVDGENYDAMHMARDNGENGFNSILTGV